MDARGRTKQQQNTHIVVIGGVRHFRADFFRRYELQPFPIDLDTLDDDSDFIKHLVGSLGNNGWDKDRPLLYSVPADPDLPNASQLRGHVLDARHRSWSWQLRFEQSMYCPEPILRPIPVTSLDNILILRAHFENLNRSKNSVVAKRHAEKVIWGRLEAHPELHVDEEKVEEFFKMNGFTDMETVAQIFKKFLKKQQNVAEKAQRRRRVGASDIFAKKFGDRLKINNDLPMEDEATSVRLMCHTCKQELVCPQCKTSYALLIKSDGSTELKKLVVANG